MAIALVAGSIASIEAVGDDDDMTVSLNAGSSANRVLVAGAGIAGNPIPAITTWTYNAVALDARSNATNPPYVRGAMRTRTNPPTGANDLRIVIDSLSADWAHGGMVFDGVDQTTPVRANSTDTAAADSANASVTCDPTVADDRVCDLCSHSASAPSDHVLPGGSDQTLRWTQSMPFSAQSMSDEVATAATTVMTRTVDGGGPQWVSCALALVPAAAGADPHLKRQHRHYSLRRTA